MKAIRYFIFVMCSIVFVACNPTPDPPEPGKDNTTDIAVTGGVNVEGLQARVTGYVNIATIDPSLVLLLEGYGIEYSTSPTFSNDIWRESMNGYTDREFTVTINGLMVNTTYYYRTYVTAGMTYYGKTASFTTDKITLTVSDITYTKATISGFEEFDEYCNIYLSTKKDRDFIKYLEYGDYSYSTDSYEEIDEFFGDTTIKGLEPGTTYYCYVSSSKGNSETVSFTTKDIDLSGVSVNYSYKPTYTSYTNWYGVEEDLTWLSGTYEYTITSNLGNKYKYGVVANNRTFYSSDTSSPYKVIVHYSAGSGIPEADDAHSRIEYLFELVQIGEATKDELQLLDDLLDEVKAIYYRNGYPYIKAFVEIDGERINIDD